MTLRPCREESVDFDNTKNLYIEGDNLEVLKILRETYLGKVKMIYIDPPYNTGKDFVYNDNYSISSANYLEFSGENDDSGNRLFLNTSSNGRFHTDWLNMIYPRLILSKDLLRDDGVIFISIDDNELRNLLKICDEIFGEINNAGIFPWQSRQSIQNDTDISINHEYVVAYAKKRRLDNRRLKESNMNSWFNRDSFVFLPVELDSDKFDNPDDDPRGLWKADPMDAPNIRPNLTYPITNPNTGESFMPPNGRHWRFEEKKFMEALKDKRIVWGRDGTGRPQLKVFYNEKKMFGSIDNSWWSGDRFGTTTQGTKELIELFDGKTPFDTPKPTKLIMNLVKMVSRDDGDIILDFFSGSGTTADALMKINNDDGVKRNYILIQAAEKCSSTSAAHEMGFSTICEIGKDRIRRSINSMPDGKCSDRGFRVFKCDSSNMRDVFYSPEGVVHNTLEDYVDVIKNDRESEDLLIQVMLELGIELSSKIEQKNMHGHTIYSVDGGYLVACFDDSIDDSTIVDISKEMSGCMYAIFRSGSSMTDEMLANIEQIFKTYSPQTKIRIL